jgi:hypothetical protein
MTNKSKVALLEEQKSNMEEIVSSLLQQKSGTQWAEKTNQLAIDYAKHLGEVYGDNWYKGFLSQDSFYNILLPKHGHSEKELDGMVFFPLDTSVKDAVRYFQESAPERSRECLKLINYLKEEIRKDGFTSSIVVAVINGTLKHVDGLHRIIALAFLLNEGYEYKPIPVFLCDSTRNQE